MRLFQHFSYANVMATVAVFIALGGTSYAVTQISGKDVRNSSLTGADVRNNSLTGVDIKNLSSGDIRNRSLRTRDLHSSVLDELKGAPGPAGKDGESIVGPAGKDGQSIVGPAGPAGKDGESIVGPPGPAGPAGESVVGPKGDKGDPGAVNVSPPVSFTAPLIDVARQNTVGKTLLMTLRAGVISDPGENGHIYLEIAPDAGGVPGAWTKVSYIAARNQANNTDAVASGGTLVGAIKAGDWYRLTTVTAAGYNAPEYVYDTGVSGAFVTLD